MTLVCEQVKCNPPPDVANATNRPVKDVYTYGDIVTYSCERDFTLIGNASLECQHEGKFHPAPPSCMFTPEPDVKCSPPPDVANATEYRPVKDVYDYGDVVTYSCKKDFTLIGNVSLKCEDDGKFHPAPPSCMFTTKPEVLDPSDDDDKTWCRSWKVISLLTSSSLFVAAIYAVFAYKYLKKKCISLYRIFKKEKDREL